MVSIGDFLDAFGFENLLLIATFLISFALINFSLKKILKDSAGQPNKAVSGVVAFAVSMLIVYGVHRIGFDLENFFYDLGLDENLLEIIVPLIILATAIWLIYKIGLVLLLIITGLLFILVSFTDWVYESETLLFAGIALLILALIIRWWKKRKTGGGYFPPASSSPVETTQRALEEGYARQLAETQAYAASKEAEAEKAKRIFQRQREIARKQRTRAHTTEELAVAQDAERRATEGIKRAEAEAEKAKRREAQVERAHAEAIEEEKRREASRKRAETAKRKATAKPSYIKLTIPETAKPNTKIKARVTWRGGLAPFYVQWGINNQPIGVLRNITRNTSTTKVLIPNLKPGETTFVNALVRDANGNFDSLQKEIRIV